MILAYLLLLTGLTISAVAIYYSVVGLAAIFSAAVIPIIVMGTTLEVAKLVCASWLKANWTQAPRLMKIYMTTAVIVLMLITSMGIFGFLSKAHSDQSLVSGDVQSKIAVYDEKIKTAKENIDANRKALKQMDEAVDQVMGRSQDEKGADKAVALRRGQAKERTRLLSEITAEQKVIAQLSEERAPIAAEVRKVEAEVGPIKYIANFIYGDNPDANVLEKAVTWVIMIIVVVFDPLAVILLLASQYSFMWFRKQQDDEQVETPVEVNEPVEEIVVETESANDAEVPETVNPHPIGWMYPKHANIQEYTVEDADDEIPVLENEETWASRVIDEEDEEQQIIENAQTSEKEAMAAWKHDHPEDSLKRQRRLLDMGVIDHLPWEDYLKPQADFAIEEAKKWAEENPQTEEAQEAKEWANESMVERPGDYITPPEVSWMENVDGHQVKKTKDGYTQNAEQNEGTLWKRIQDAKK